MKSIRGASETGAILLGVDASDPGSIYACMLAFLVERGLLPQEMHDRVLEALLEREAESSTAVGRSVAIPHLYLDEIPEPVILFARLRRGVQLGAPDGIPTRFVFMLLGPTTAARQHVDTLATIARLMADDEFRYDASFVEDAEELDQALRRFEIRTAGPVIPTPERPEGLEFTGRFAGGLIEDVRRRLPHYWSDFREGLHPKAVASTMFLFFACLAPAVTFGGVMADQTGGQIGAVEMLVASAVCGIVYSLFSGQPLIVLGGTGPMLIITTMLYALTQSWGLPFLPVYGWVGLWSALFLVLLALFDAGAWMRYFTRFTDEVFAALISIIFIYEAGRAIAGYLTLGRNDDHDAAFLSLILALGCFAVALSLQNFRRSRYLRHNMREFLSDFGPTVAIAAMTLLLVRFEHVAVDTLDAPDRFGTTSGRPWLIDLFSVPAWVIAGASLPAILVAILVYLDQNITARVVNSPDHRLKKGPAYHLDLGLVGLLVAACSVVGIPWLVAATVRSLNHVRSLATAEEQVGKTTQERILHVRETRVVALAVHLLIGVSLLALPLLKLVPMAVLYGLFLYMGVVSLRGNQFFERLLLWPMDSRLYPMTHYIRRVPHGVIHRFTAIQLACLVVLWLVKTSRFGLLFPLFIAILAPVRLALGRFVKPEHLRALDSEETAGDEESAAAGP